MRSAKKYFLAISMMMALFLLPGCSKETESYSHTDFAMGTVTNMTLYGKNTDLEKKEQQIVKKMKELETEQISWRVKSSALAKLNQQIQEQKGKAEVSEPLKGWLLEALKISRDSYSNGRNTVDPSIGVLTGLWDFESENLDSEHPEVPEASKIKQAIRGLSENGSNITIKKDGTLSAKNTDTQFDLGAYGKGIGIDEAKKLLEKDSNISGAMVALGGSILVYGEKPDGEAWNVGIQSPSGKDGEVLGALKVNGNASISTSGDYEKYFTDPETGKRYFHILDSKTGYSVETEIVSCTIVCDSGIDSDGLSTACFALGVQNSQELLKKYDAKAIFVDKSKRVYVSEGLDFTLRDDQYKLDT